MVMLFLIKHKQFKSYWQKYFLSSGVVILCDFPDPCDVILDLKMTT